MRSIVSVADRPMKPYTAGRTGSVVSVRARVPAHIRVPTTSIITRPTGGRDKRPRFFQRVNVERFATAASSSSYRVGSDMYRTREIELSAVRVSDAAAATTVNGRD